MLRRILHIVVGVCLCAPVLSFAGASPSRFMKDFVGEIRLALEKGDVREANMLFAKHFDMARFGKRCLIDHWDEFSDQEKATYIDLLDRNIRKRIGEKMLFTKDDKDFKFTPRNIRSQGDGVVSAENMLSIKKGDFRLVLSLVRAGNEFRLVDYELEGALLSRNYRGQFNYLIRTYGKEGFLEKLRNKTEPSANAVASN